MNVVFIVFNRPEVTQRVFDRIAAARPQKLLLIADGPRPDRSTDSSKVALVREIVAKVDWPCEVYRNFAEENLGCKQRVSSGLDWAFSIVEEAIILEDDCLPDMTFFSFCQELLERYRYDERVMHIGGGNYQHGIRRSSDSYYFSKYPHGWGWASWRRAWQCFDFHIKKWPELRATDWMRTKCPSNREQQYWTDIYDRSYRAELNAWDYQWNFACWVQGGVSIVPEVNLVENIGFGPDATNTVEKWEGIKAVMTGSLKGKLRHPKEILVNKKADKYTFKKVFSPPSNLACRLSETFFSKYFYGRYFRKIPIIGSLWARWRARR
jgi:hypothetical protein